MANDVNIFTADLERAVNMLMDIKPYCDGIYCEEFEEYGADYIVADCEELRKIIIGE